MNTRSVVRAAATVAKSNTKNRDSLETRRELLVSLLTIVIPENQIIICDREKPAKGAAFSVIELSDRYRINYRCGYSRNNYAPCVEVLK